MSTFVKLQNHQSVSCTLHLVLVSKTEINAVLGFSSIKTLSSYNVKDNCDFNGKRLKLLQCKTVNWLTESFRIYGK